MLARWIGDVDESIDRRVRGGVFLVARSPQLCFFNLPSRATATIGVEATCKPTEFLWIIDHRFLVEL